MALLVYDWRGGVALQRWAQVDEGLEPFLAACAVHHSTYPCIYKKLNHVNCQVTTD